MYIYQGTGSHWGRKPVKCVNVYNCKIVVTASTASNNSRYANLEGHVCIYQGTGSHWGRKPVKCVNVYNCKIVVTASNNSRYTNLEGHVYIYQRSHWGEKPVNTYLYILYTCWEGYMKKGKPDYTQTQITHTYTPKNDDNN